MNKMNAGNPRNYDFSRVPGAEISRSRLYRPSSHMTTIGCDYLYPLFWDEVLPGDTFKLDVGVFARMASALVPFMSNLYLDWQFFFVPTRLVWSNWQRFCGEQDNPTDSTDYTVPYLAPPVSGGVSTGSLYDYFGIPVGKTWAAHDIQSLPFRCYNLIWNEWYRDENLQTSVSVPKGDGPDALSVFTLLKRGKRKDYFTSCLPWPQKGPDVTIPLITDATLPVRGTGKNMQFTIADGTGYGTVARSNGGIALATSAQGSDVGAVFPNSSIPSWSASDNKAVGLTTNAANSGVVADLNTVLDVVNINQLRTAFQMQKFFERMARGGTRYIEILQSMFGVTSPDARLQRPEVLGSFSFPLQLVQNTQTSASLEGGTPQGNLAANGVFTGSKFAFNKSFVEHGYIIGLCSIRSDLAYQQGLFRGWSRSTKYDFYWPTFAHLGEQPVLNKEIYLQDASVKDSNQHVVNDKTFGYQERWSEYKYGRHLISGELRSQYSQSLDLWHLAQYFQSLPTLSSSFISENVPISRVLSVDPDEAKPFVIDTAFDLVCVRPLPLWDVPGLVDHF